MIHHLTTPQDSTKVDGKPAKFLIVETAAGFAVGYIITTNKEQPTKKEI